MTAALQSLPDHVCDPVWFPPHRSAPAGRPATVTVLHRPADIGDDVPLRLTRRGMVVVTCVVALLGAALLVLAARSGAAANDGATGAARPSTVTVRVGDTLWSIASRVAPQRDPRGEVDALQHRNRLTGVTLQPGQVLRVP